MRKLKKLFVLSFFLIMIMILPKNVLAQQKFSISNMTINSNAVTSCSGSSANGSYTLYIGITGDFSFKLTTSELDESKTYTVTLKSDFINTSYDYTGAELNSGVDLAIANAKSYIDLTIAVKNTTERVSYWYDGSEDEYYDSLTLMFSDEIDTTELDAFFNTMLKNNKIELDTIEIKGLYSESSISSALSKYKNDKFDMYGYCDDKCYLYLQKRDDDYHSKLYEVNYLFKPADKTIKEKVSEYAKKMDKDNIDKIMDDLYIMVDLENINYRFSTLDKKEDDMDKINSIINYSSELQKDLEYGNLDAKLDIRAGWGTDFDDGAFGFINLIYNDIIYGVANGVGVWQINVIYIPDNTENTREAYIKAAEDRIKGYLKDADVKITYAGKINDYLIENGMDDNEFVDRMLTIVDTSKTLGEYYNVSLNGKTFKFFISKNSKKMNKPFMNTKDMKTNIYVTTDDSEAPLDSMINTTILDKNSNEYKNILKKLKLTDGISANIELFSKTKNAYIKKLSNGKFKVYIPISDKYNNKKLAAYYVGSNGNIEIHDVTIKDGYAIFETDHFSTYTIGEADKTTSTGITNPPTSDNINIYFILLGLSFIGLICNNKIRKKL